MPDELLLLKFDCNLKPLKAQGENIASEVAKMLAQITGEFNQGQTSGISLTIEVTGIKNPFASLPDNTSAGVKLTGPATDYALFWEWGKVSIKPGPKTVDSTNFQGESVVLTRTAPHGWIRVNREQYIQALRTRFKAVRFGTLPLERWGSAIDDFLRAAAKDCAQIMEDTAPHDTYDLISGIIAVNEPDPALEGTENEYGPTEFNLGAWL